MLYCYLLFPGADEQLGGYGRHRTTWIRAQRPDATAPPFASANANLGSSVGSSTDRADASGAAARDDDGDGEGEGAGAAAVAALALHDPQNFGQIREGFKLLFPDGLDGMADTRLFDSLFLYLPFFFNVVIVISPQHICFRFFFHTESSLSPDALALLRRRRAQRALSLQLRHDVSRIWLRNLGRDDRAVAACAREARSPFLDEGVMAFLARFQDGAPGDACSGKTISERTENDTNGSNTALFVDAEGDEGLMAFVRDIFAAINNACNEDSCNDRAIVAHTTSEPESATPTASATVTVTTVEHSWPVLPLRALCDPRLPAGAGDKQLLRLVARALGLRGAGRLVKRAMQFGTRLADKEADATATVGPETPLERLVNPRFVGEAAAAMGGKSSKDGKNMKSNKGGTNKAAVQ